MEKCRHCSGAGEINLFSADYRCNDCMGIGVVEPSSVIQFPRNAKMLSKQIQDQGIKQREDIKQAQNVSDANRTYQSDVILSDLVGRFDEVIVIGLNKTNGLHYYASTNDNETANLLATTLADMIDKTGGSVLKQ